MGSWLLLGYSFVFLFLFFIFAWLRVSGRKDRHPFPDGVRLLRGPGESLRRRIEAINEAELRDFLIAYSAPMLVSGLLLWITSRLTGSAQVICLILTFAVLLVTVALLTRRLVRRFEIWRNHYLGYFGERVVAEALEPLKVAGHRVFHDVPGDDTKARFNLDHVVVGPSGVFVIETKTRRKGRARAGFMANQIIYDGRVLAYPWGEDRHGLDQAQRQARWLEEHLARLTGQTIPVHPVLTFPGWMIVRRGTGPVNVLNPKEIPAAIIRPASELPALTEAQIDLVARQLDERCRDVEL